MIVFFCRQKIDSYCNFFSKQLILAHSVGVGEGTRDARNTLSAVSLIFVQLLAKILPNNRSNLLPRTHGLAPPVCEILDPLITDI